MQYSAPGTALSDVSTTLDATDLNTGDARPSTKAAGSGAGTGVDTLFSTTGDAFSGVDLRYFSDTNGDTGITVRRPHGT